MGVQLGFMAVQPAGKVIWAGSRGLASAGRSAFRALSSFLVRALQPGLACFYGDGLGNLGAARLEGGGGRVPGEGDLLLAQALHVIRRAYGSRPCPHDCPVSDGDRRDRLVAHATRDRCPPPNMPSARTDPGQRAPGRTGCPGTERRRIPGGRPGPGRQSAGTDSKPRYKPARGISLSARHRGGKSSQRRPRSPPRCWNRATQR
jgi:hypothetical protein